MSNNFWEEVDKLVAEYDATRTNVTSKNRLYYDAAGCIIGLWKTDYPAGDNYIVLDSTEVFDQNNTLLLRVKDNRLVVLDPKEPVKVRLVKAASGFKTVRGHAALIIEPNESYTNIEYYDRRTN